jgi:hypothetical protein
LIWTIGIQVGPSSEEEENPMRRASVCLALLGLVVLCQPVCASAAPAVTFKAVAVPIPGFAHTGNILGAGTALKIEYRISGTEYGGFPPPLIGINFFTPAGSRINTKGFATCSPAALEKTGPSACSAKSKITIAGEALGVVAFGSERVAEKTLVKGFFAPGGALQFYTQGSSPVALEFISPGHYVNSGGSYAQKFITAVPLVETVPGAPDASVLSVKVTVGAAYRKGKKTVYYGTEPKRCPKGGFPLKSELLFAGLGGLAPQTVPVTYKAPCPRK